MSPSTAAWAGHSSGTSAMHLVVSEINAVTSAIRRHARSSTSTSFLGSNSGAAQGIGGPVAGGSSSASLLKSAVQAASASLVPVASASGRGLEPDANGSATASWKPDNAPSSDANRAHGRHRSIDYSAASMSPTTPLQKTVRSSSISLPESGISKEATPLHYVYADGRRDDSLVGLLNAFTILRAQLQDRGSVDAIPQPLLILPFLRVILSARTTGPVTSVALQAIFRLLTHGIVAVDASLDDAGIVATRQDGRDSAAYLHTSTSQLAIAEIAHAVSHCRFEASDPVTDELVLLRILAIMRELICPDDPNAYSKSSYASGGIHLGALADHLSDESICEMMETGLSMCCQMRLSELLRSTAEQSLTTMIRALFARLSHIPLAEDEAYSKGSDGQDVEPEHATLAADHVGDDGLDAESKKLRRMTMPDPKSSDVPAAGLISPAAMQELKSLGERQDEERLNQIDEEVNDNAAQTDESLNVEQQAEEAVQDTKGDPSEETAKENLVRVDVKPYGLPAIKEVLRVIISLLDPSTQQHTTAMRLLGLSMLNVVFQVAGQRIAQFPSLRALVQDSACKHLFTLARSDNASLVASSLQTLSTLFETMREHLKLQYEMLVSNLVDRLAPTFPFSMEPWRDDASSMLSIRRSDSADSKSNVDLQDPGTATSTPPPPPPPPPFPRTSDRSPSLGETREATIEALGMLLGLQLPHRDGTDPFVELWINYDCDVDCTDVFESVIHFLCRSVYAANPLHPQTQESTQLFAIDAILRFVSQMAARQEAEASGFEIQSQWPSGLPSATSLAAQKETKAAILAGAEKFNEKPKEGLKYFEQSGFIEPISSSTREISVARFLKECPGLDKKLLGDFISRPENEGILGAFLRLFDFKGTPIAEALREMLEAFRLPGESQQIARITESFASIYFATKPEGIKSEDAVYILSYSIIMLNTDLHNPQNKRRMSVDDYRKNLRGVNDSSDFDQDFLGAIHESIRRREIVMPEEHKGQLGFDYQWKELLRRSRKAGGLLCVPTTHFDRAIFNASWRPVLASIAHAFSTFRDEHLLERAIIGFRQCALLASRFGMYELFDFMIQGLASATGLLDANGVGSVTNNAVVDFEEQTITVSPLSVQFGRNFKGQLAAVVLFTIANGNGHAVRKGWAPIFEICKNLFINSLLSPQLGLMFEFGLDAEAGQRQLPIRAKRLPGPSPQDPRSQSGAGIFSTISSYLLSPYSNDKEVARPDIAVTEEAVESTLCTVDCLASCRIEELFLEMSRLNGEIRREALEALRQLADRYTIERRAYLLSEQQGGSGNDSSGRSTPIQSTVNASHGPLLRNLPPLPYDPSSAFLLELATDLVSSADLSEASQLWTIVSDHTVALISSPGQYHSLQIERAVVSLFRLIAHISTEIEHREKIFIALDQLNGLPAEYRTIVAAQVTGGLHAILSVNPAFAKSKTEWNVVLTMLAIYGNARSAQAVHRALVAVGPLLSVREEQESASNGNGAGARLSLPGTTLDNFAGLVALLRDYARAADTLRFDAGQGEPETPQARKTLTEKKALKEYEDACQERGPAAVQSLELLKSHITRLAREMGATTNYQVWTTLWMPLMSAIALQYTNAHRPTRQAALAHLQRVMLTPEIFPLEGSTSQDHRDVLHALFNTILFPTLHELLKPEVFQLDPGNENGSMQETRIRSCNLLCKVYLHYLGKLTDPTITAAESGEVDEHFLRLWLTILDFFDRFMHSGKRDHLTEATPENLKNVLLVMNASGLLLPPPATSEKDTRTIGQQQLYDATFDRIQRFLPKLKDEIFPAPIMVETTVVETAQAQPPIAPEQHELPTNEVRELNLQDVAPIDDSAVAPAQVDEQPREP